MLFGNVAHFWIAILSIVGWIDMVVSANDCLPALGCGPIVVNYNTVGANRLENPQVINSSEVNLQFSCLATNQLVEWVYNWDPAPPSGRNKPKDYELLTTEVKISNSSKLQIALMTIKFDRLSVEESLLCRTISNHSNNVQIRLEPNSSTEQVHITTTREVFVWEKERPSISNPDLCLARLLVTYVDGKYYETCRGANSTQIYRCKTSPACANLYRDIKMPAHCVSVLHNVTKTELVNSWKFFTPGNYQPRVVKCEFEGTHGKRARVAAWELFFSGTRSHTGKTPKMHFSLSEIEMRYLIWFDPAPQNETHYIILQDTFETRCHTSLYGLATVVKILVTFNGSRILDLTSGVGALNSASNEKLNAVVSKSIVLEFSKHGPGSYQIDCSSRVWNTNEVVTRTATIDVEQGLEPYFNSKTELITFEEGETGRRVVCDAYGIPTPEVSWEQVDLPGVWVDGDGRLVLDKVYLSWNNYHPIKCTATSKLGNATKEFKLFIAEKRARTDQTEPTSDSNTEAATGTSLSSTTIIALVVGLLCAGLLALGLFYFHRMLTRFSKAVAGHLTSDEVQAFVHGTPSSRVSGSGVRIDEVDQRVSVECLPYNSYLEVAENEIFIDFGQELGSGHYGIVYKGQVRTTPVALKTVRPNVPIEYFKALMSELKILAHIGSHEHIVNLVGANSSNIKNRKLFVGVELCKVSLLKHLRDNQPAAAATARYVNTGGFQLQCEQEIRFGDYANQDAAIGLTADNLLRWAAEIATGMEFMAEKRIVHGDLAARNVLLSFNMRAKICDFGLARQLVDYTYIKSQRCELPWKWMAPESLAQMRFSTKSDVWAFGVTCWEMFSYGSVPYACTQWTLEFVGQLAKGLRLPKPDYASDVIYAKMMDCWCQDRQARPNFTDLKHFFAQLAISE